MKVFIVTIYVTTFFGVGVLLTHFPSAQPAIYIGLVLWSWALCLLVVNKWK